MRMPTTFLFTYSSLTKTGNFCINLGREEKLMGRFGTQQAWLLMKLETYLLLIMGTIEFRFFSDVYCREI